MCGLAGILLARPGGDLPGPLAAMTARLAHRGPDSDGAWSDPSAGIALGHRRLAILELSRAGHQPMRSASGRLVLVYNGEIYNHPELRARLAAEGRAPGWAGQSDTETLLAAIEAWGLEGALSAARGMFALALWDRAARRLSLARDRFGEKPLLYGWQGTGAGAAFLFASELGAIEAHPACPREIDRGALVRLMRHGHVGEQAAIYAGLARVPPGGIVTLSAADPAPRITRYFSAEAQAGARGDRTPPRDAAEAIEAVGATLSGAVGEQMLSDVPLGAFLSGGVDSSLVVALMQRAGAGRVRSFSIGFHEPRFDEAHHARAVAEHLGTEHSELYVGPQELRETVPRLAAAYDEPFADSSQIPTLLLAGLARRSVTVALSGDGGDELFGGYDRYRQGAALARVIAALPRGLRALAAGAVTAVPMGAWDRLLGPLRPVPEGKEPNGQRLHRLADYLASPDIVALHRKLVSRWRFPERAVPGTREPAGLLDPGAVALSGLGRAERMMLLDLLTYLPDDILAKVDRAAMHVSLETRAPFLDPRVAALAWSLPEGLKIREGQGKWVLRRLLDAHVPRALTDRPKAGFEVPIGAWLRGPMRDWAEALIAPDRLAREGLFDPAEIRRVWAEHLSGRCNWGLQLWPVLMVQSWREARG